MLDFKRINGKFHKALTNGLKEMNIGITPVQSRLLLFIKENEEVTATDILENFKSVNKSTLSEILNNLEKNGYIARQEAKDDSRKKIIALTDKSLIVVEELKENFDLVSDKVLEDISKEEYEQLKNLLDKIERSTDKLC
jgi:DNA-binding MarR family transcriptional regulator